MSDGILLTAAPSAPTVLTPAEFGGYTGVDGEEVYLEVTDGDGKLIYWRLRYNPGSPETQKWEFVSGPPFRHDILTDQSTASTTFADLATVGPSFTAPRDGVYVFEFGAGIYNTGGSNSNIMGLNIAGAAPPDDLEVARQFSSDAGSMWAVSMRSRRKTLAATNVVKAVYKTSAGTFHAAARWLDATPLRIA